MVDGRKCQIRARLCASFTFLLASWLCLASWQDAGAENGEKTKRNLNLLRQFAIDILSNPADGSGRKPGAQQPDANNFNGAPSPGIEPEPLPQISGFEFRMAWQAHDGSYSGILVMPGPVGVFRVQTPARQTIDQRMEARPYNRDVSLVGSNPTYAGTNVLASNYQPDAFRLTQLPSRVWTIADTCDGLRCSPVFVASARAF